MGVFDEHLCGEMKSSLSCGAPVQRKYFCWRAPVQQNKAYLILLHKCAWKRNSFHFAAQVRVETKQGLTLLREDATILYVFYFAAPILVENADNA